MGKIDRIVKNVAWFILTIINSFAIASVVFLILWPAGFLGFFIPFAILILALITFLEIIVGIIQAFKRLF